MIDGLVIGSRKAGTSWLHSNFLNDPFFSTTFHTKETNYWGTDPRCVDNQYETLFQQDSGVFRVECDASLCTDPATIPKLIQHRLNPSIVLILRNPKDFLVSRYIHSKRKGEISKSTKLDDFLSLKWVQAEINYQGIVDNYKNQFKINVIKFEHIYDSPHDYYTKICSLLSSDYRSDASFALDKNKVNQMRTSRFPMLSKAQTSIATSLRNMGFHRLVNTLKKSNIHSTWENQNDQRMKDDLYSEASTLNHDLILQALQTWSELA